LLNTSDEIASLLNYHDAYNVFCFIVHWINWQVPDPKKVVQQYYQCYFSDYSRDERKRVMNSVGLEILDFVQNSPLSSELNSLVLSTHSEIIPLLDSEYLPVYWRFFFKIAPGYIV
jgi:hypothetical protein